MEHHIDGAHSLTGEIADYASEAHKAMGGALHMPDWKKMGKVGDAGATIARKALRTGAKVAELTAAPALMLGASTGNAAILGYGEMAPVAAEAARMAALGIGQTQKMLRL